MTTITKSQKKILDYVTTYIEDKGVSPTFREIQAHFQLASLGSVYNYIQVLKKKGLLLDHKRSPIALVKGNNFPKEITLPLIGYIAAGFPIETFPQTKQIDVLRILVRNPEDTYVMKVKGETLIDEHIIDGDLLLIEPKGHAEEGDLIVAHLNQNDTIVKRYFPEGAYVRLESSDHRHDPIILNARELVIQGVIVGLIRNFN